MEAITESISQLCISCIILRIYGVSTFTFTKFFQFFSLITSLLSLCVAFGTVSIFFLQKVKKTIEKKKPIWFFFFQRQTFLQPMVTKPLEVSVKGIFSWVFSKVGFIIYFLSASLPIVCYVICLVLVAIKRESSMVLSIIMVAVIHPIVTLALGILTKTIGTLVFKKCTPDGHFSRCANYLLTVIGRLCTYSINVHLTFLAGIVLYAFNWWYSLEVRDVDYANEAFNQCICKPTEEKKGLQCPKPEFITNFQNDVNSVPLHTLLLTFVILSIAFHIIQSVITFFPPPLRLFDFIFGPVQEGSKSHDKEKYLKWFKIVFCFLGLTYVIALFCVPLTFHLLSEDIDEVENGKA